MITVPIRTVSALNSREHWRARTSRVRAERQAVAWLLRKAERPPVPCTVLLTRCAPSSGLDDDNLLGALKGVRDQVAEWLGINDRDAATVRYRYAQRRAPWGVTIEFQQPVVGAQFELAGAT